MAHELYPTADISLTIRRLPPKSRVRDKAFRFHGGAPSKPSREPKDSLF
jgi:hypothetical protein